MTSQHWLCIYGSCHRQETLDLPYLTLLCDNLKNRMFLQNFFYWPYFGSGSPIRAPPSCLAILCAGTVHLSNWLLTPNSIALKITTILAFLTEKLQFCVKKCIFGGQEMTSRRSSGYAYAVFTHGPIWPNVATLMLYLCTRMQHQCCDIEQV
jgi:hypothetical protein